MIDQVTEDPAIRNSSGLKHLLVPALLAALVGVAYWLRTRPGTAPAPMTTGATSTESTQALLARGIRAHDAGAPDAAMDLYHKVLEREPANATAHYNIAQIYNARGPYAQAQWEYEAALKSDPKFVDARINLGVVLYRLHQFPAAAAEFQQVLDAAPRHPQALFNLGTTLIEMGQADQAVRPLRAALAEDPKSANTHYYLGVALERQHKLPEAKAELQEALALSPRHADAYLALSRVYREQGEPRFGPRSVGQGEGLNPRLEP